MNRRKNPEPSPGSGPGSEPPKKINAELVGGPADGEVKSVDAFLGQPPLKVYWTPGRHARGLPTAGTGWKTYWLCSDGKYRMDADRKRFEIRNMKGRRRF